MNAINTVVPPFSGLPNVPPSTCDAEPFSNAMQGCTEISVEAENCGGADNTPSLVAGGNSGAPLNFQQIASGDTSSLTTAGLSGFFNGGTSSVAGDDCGGAAVSGDDCGSTSVSDGPTVGGVLGALNLTPPDMPGLTPALNKTLPSIGNPPVAGDAPAPAAPAPSAPAPTGGAADPLAPAGSGLASAMPDDHASRPADTLNQNPNA